MSSPILALGCTVLLCSLSHSIFGIGLLVFGTPVLLLLGYPFPEVLSYLLPCSIAVNALQVFEDWRLIRLKKEFTLYCLPWVLTGATITLMFGTRANIKVWVGSLMLLTALLRMSGTARARMPKALRRHMRPALFTIGSVQGLTNMGCGLLSAFFGGIETEKRRVRAAIAFGNMSMAMCQLAVLSVRGGFHPGPLNAVLMVLALATYLMIGDRIFRASSEGYFQHLLTGVFVAFGISLFL